MSNNLPVEVKKGFLNIQKDKKEKIIKATKAIVYAGVLTAGFGLAWGGGSTVLGLLSIPTLGAGTIGFLRNTLIKTYSDSLFGIRQGRKVAHIEQNSLGIDQIKLQTKMKELFKDEKSSTKEKYKKGGLMALQTLIMLEREKMALEKDPKIENEKGVYKKNYKTVTHGINIENMKLLEELGYIKIESDIVKKESYLIIEKLGFGQGKEIRKLVKAIITGNSKEKKSIKKEMHTLDFKITDKNIDIEELYKLYNTNKQKMKRFQALFSKNGILATKNIDIQKDEYGVPYIRYDSNKSFVQRVEDEKVTKTEQQSLRDRVNVKDDLSYQKQAEIAETWKSQPEQISKKIQEKGKVNKENYNDMGE